MNFISRKFHELCLKTTFEIVLLKGLYFLNIIFNAFALFFMKKSSI